MNSSAAAETYRTASIENAPPLKIIRLLYQGALRYLEQAIRADVGVDKVDLASMIGHVDDIVVELRLCLNHDADPGGTVSQNLESLYLFCERELGEALVDRDKKHLENVKTVLSILSEAWQRLELDTVDEN